MKRIITMLMVMLMMAMGNFLKAQDFNVAISGGTPLPVNFDQSEYPWIVSDGCVSSSDIVGLKTSWFSTTIEILETGVVSFDYKVQSWGYGETFKFSINDSDSIFLQSRQDWTHASYELNKGIYTLKWSYILSEGYTDAYAYVKNLEISGIETDEPFLGLMKNTVNFKNKLPDTVTKDTIEVINLGKQDLQIKNISGLSSPFNIMDWPKEAIKGGEKAKIVIAFSPEKEDYWQQQFLVETNGGNQLIHIKALCSEGYGVEVPIAGSLSSILTQEQKDTITNLSLMGRLNGDDFYVLRRDMPKLRIVNMAAAFVKDKSIPYAAFEGNRTLEKVVLPVDSLELIGDNSFQNCSSLTLIDIPASVLTIGRYAFQNCLSLKAIMLPNCTRIKDWAFSYCSSLNRIEFPQIAYIEPCAFVNCSMLPTVNFPITTQELGWDIFNGCHKLKEVTIQAETPPTSSNGSNIFNEYGRVMYVPAGYGNVYSTATGWTNNAIVDGTSVAVKVDVETAGTLGEEILKQVEYVSNVNDLTISGVLNSDDFYQIQNRMPNLISIDMSAVKMEALPDYFFNTRTALLNIKLPENLKSIGNYAFHRCYGLTELALPEGLESIGESAFRYCYSLENINLPSTLAVMGSYAFNDCSSLKPLVIPNSLTYIADGTFEGCNFREITLSEGLKIIGRYAFRGCSSLEKIVFPSSLERINYYAFRGCSGLSQITFSESSKLTTMENDAFGECISLKEVTLPASLNWCSTPFQECTNLKRLTCYASVPPVLDGNYDPLYYVDKTDCELFVPYWSLNNYKLTPGWDAIPVIKPIIEDMKDIYINRALTFADTIRPANNPNVILYDQGRFTINGKKALSLGNYVQNHTTSLDWYGNLTWDYSSFTSLINESEGMRADSVALKVIVNNMADNKWIFFSVPFDTKVADMDIPEGILYVIYRYDGASRATSGSGQSWKKLGSDDLLNAGEGYIIQFNQRSVSDFVLKALNNENKNKIFASTDLSISLKEHVSEFVHNRSWNFVGNPYPCFFDIRYIDYQAPITIRSGEGYKALSLTDDAYVLKPMEAFFVQKPVGVDAITFRSDGRQHESTVKERASMIQSRHDENSKREVYNLSFGDESYADETRFVINDEASIDYEMDKDASKFMSENRNLPQIYTVEDGVTYAINERPVANRVIAVGVHVGQDGLYTFSLNEMNNASSYFIYLIDKETQKEVLLNDGDYSVHLNPGEYDQRFELHMRIVPTGIADSISENTFVTVDNGRINVKTEIGTDIRIYSITGEMVNEYRTQYEETSISILPGAYIVLVNGRSFKALVTE